jgi:hypothetical protein
MTQLRPTPSRFRFHASVFWYCILPPIILAQAFNLNKRVFFKNLEYALIFGIFGTLVRAVFETEHTNPCDEPACRQVNFLLLALAGYYSSRMGWVWRAGCSSHAYGAFTGNESPDCLEDFNVVKSVLLGESPAPPLHARARLPPRLTASAPGVHASWLWAAALLSASDGAAAIKHLGPESAGRLGAMVLGENVLNEATSILLFQASLDDYESDKKDLSHRTGLRALILLCSAIGIGVLTGLVCCRIFFRYQTFK